MITSYFYLHRTVYGQFVRKSDSQLLDAICRLATIQLQHPLYDTKLEVLAQRLLREIAAEEAEQAKEIEK